MLKRYLSAAICLLFISSSWSIAQAPPVIRNSNNPPLFQSFAAPVSGSTRFLLSEHGLSLLRHSNSPVAVAVLKALGEPLPATSDYPAPIPPQSEPVIESEAAWPPASTAEPVTASPQNVLLNGCGINGTVFNLEPAVNAAPQGGESLDFIYNGGTAGADLVVASANDFRSGIVRTFYYTHRTSTGCSPAFEGALPDLMGLSGEADSGDGGAVVAADPARGAFFIADQHLGSNNIGGTTAIGVFRTTSANLVSTAVCPSGTHTSAQAAACWPARRLINPLPKPMIQFSQEFPSLAVDSRTAGLGAGDVYITGTEFDAGEDTSRTWLVACTNNLGLCSSPVFISGSDSNTLFSDVHVRPDGGITVSYVDEVFSPSTVFDIRYTACQPGGAPFTPVCSPPGLVSAEGNPVEFLMTEPVFPVTSPKHAHRVDAGVTQTFVVWNRCKVTGSFLCPDSDVAMKFSTNNGASWSPLTAVDTGPDDQFLPAISTDVSRQTVNIAYFNNHIDPIFQHLVLVDLVQIPTGTTTPTAPINITTTPDDLTTGALGLSFESFESIGLAVKGTGSLGASRIYDSYSYNLRFGSYNGIPGPQQDNYLSSFRY